METTNRVMCDGQRINSKPEIVEDSIRVIVLTGTSTHQKILISHEMARRFVEHVTESRLDTQVSDVGTIQTHARICDREMQMADLTSEEKATFLAATNRRKAAGIKLKRVSFMATSEQVDAFNTLLDAFITRWGKNKAIDHIISILSRIEARMQDAENQK